MRRKEMFSVLLSSFQYIPFYNIVIAPQLLRPGELFIFFIIFYYYYYFLSTRNADRYIIYTPFYYTIFYLICQYTDRRAI